MASPVAVARHRERQRLATRTAVIAQGLWDQLDPDDLTRSMVVMQPSMVELVSSAQTAAATGADVYVDELLEGRLRPAGRVRASAFARVASDGRPLASLLVQPVISAKVRMGRGAPLTAALAGGRFQLGRIVATQIYDAGRVADGVAVAARGAGYVRMLRQPSCSRCIVLAGRTYRWNDGFQRHPSCDCVHVPAPQAALEGLVTDPRQVFESLSHADQDRLFGAAGAQAIRDGADLAQVVNARRGLSTAGGRFTLEGTTRRGFAGRRLEAAGAAVQRRPGSRYGSVTTPRLRTPRLMPEAIYELSATRDEAIEALRRHGFLV